MGIVLTPQENTAIRRKIAKVLAGEPGLGARAISNRTGVSAATCSQVLFGSPDFFSATGSPPNWKNRRSPAAKKRVAKKATYSAAKKSKSSTKAKPSKSKPSDEGKKRLKKSERTENWDNFDILGKLPTMASLKLYQWQKQAFAAWVEAGRSGVVNAVTGAGKTRLALAAIRDQLGRRGRIVIVVPNQTLQEQWYLEIKERFPGRSIGRLGSGHKQTLQDCQILIAVAASGRRYSFGIEKNSNCLLIADECHRYASPENRKVLEEGFNTRLGLTATHERMDNLHLEVLLPYFGGIVYNFGYRDAIDAKVIAPFRFAFVGASFTKKEQKRYDELSEELKNLRSKLVKGFGAADQPFSAYLADLQNFKNNGPKQAGILSGMWEKRWTERRHLMAGSQEKLKNLDRIRNIFLDADRSLVFTMSIESAEEVVALLRSRGIASAVHSSKISGEERRKMLDAFANGRIKVLASVVTLEEGVDVPEADLGIIIGSTAQRRQMIQRMGRVIRKKPDKRYARFVYMFIKGTVEDPSQGAHESFLQELWRVADEIDSFKIPGDVGQLRTFLKPKRRSKVMSKSG
jgi:superfamily II DNA or RNA helicase